MATLPRLTARLRLAARVAGASVSLAGALVFGLWALGTPKLDRALSSHFIMQLNTGAAFVLAGATLWLRSPRVQRVCAALVIVSGLFMIGEHLHTGEVLPGRMEPDTALGFILIGTALLLRGSKRPLLSRLSDGLTIGCLLIAMVGLFGFTYNVKFFFGVAKYVHMSLGTALSFVALAIGALFAEPEHGVMAAVVSDSAGGVMARRLYPAAVGIPILLGQLTLIGEGLRLYNGKFGLSLFLLVSIIVFVSLCWWTYGAIDRADAQRMRLAAVLLEEAERRHLAKELHDEIGQALAGLNLNLQTAASSEPVDKARAIVRELLERVSNLSLDLRPTMLDDLGLIPALVWLFERYQAQTGVQVRFAHSGVDARMPPDLETAAFRIVQEGLTNVARHAAVREVDVRVFVGPGQRDRRTLTVQVVDRGRGFDVERAYAAHRSTGLSGMRERAAALGGELTVESTADGTFLSAEMPLDGAAELPAVRA
jgi:signal transduction histidine kinase